MTSAAGTEDCAYCEAQTDDDFVQCDRCDVWVHYKCAHVDDSIKEKVWECKLCVLPLPPTGKVMHSPLKQQDASASGGITQSERLEEQVSSLKIGNKAIDNKKKKLELELLYIKKQLELLNEEDSDIKSEKENKDTLVSKVEIRKVEDKIKIGKLEDDSLEQSFSKKSCGSCEFDKFNSTLIDLKKLNIRQAVPKDLPEFGGKAEEWLLFVTTFESTTKMCGYSDEENLLRLRKALKGRAYDAVSGLLSSHKGVPLIVDTLKMLFGAPEKIVDNLLSKIRKMPPINGESSTQIINFGLEVRNLVTMMENVNLNDYVSNPFILTELTEKLPFYMQVTWGEAEEKLNRNLKTFSEWLYKKAEIASQMSKGSNYDNRSTGTRGHRVNMHNSDENKPQIRCYLCKGEHMLVKCPEFEQLDINGRWIKLKE